MSLWDQRFITPQDGKSGTYNILHRITVNFDVWIVSTLVMEILMDNMQLYIFEVCYKTHSCLQ